jgi:hypothetical protein
VYRESRVICRLFVLHSELATTIHGAIAVIVGFALK